MVNVLLCSLTNTENIQPLVGSRESFVWYLGFWIVLLLHSIFCYGECPIVFSNKHQEHPTTSWLEGTICVIFGVLEGRLGQTSFWKLASIEPLLASVLSHFYLFSSTRYFCLVPSNYYLYLLGLCFAHLKWPYFGFSLVFWSFGRVTNFLFLLIHLFVFHIDNVVIKEKIMNMWLRCAHGVPMWWVVVKDMINFGWVRRLIMMWVWCYAKCLLACVVQVWRIEIVTYNDVEGRLGSCWWTKSFKE
jgi:hypothetical protein